MLVEPNVSVFAAALEILALRNSIVVQRSVCKNYPRELCEHLGRLRECN